MPALLILATSLILSSPLAAAEPEAPTGAVAEPSAPQAILPVNRTTESAQAVYLADAAAKDRGNRSRVAVLGTTHLRQSLHKDFDFKRFGPLLDKLEAWAPERIAVEGIAGPQCDYLRAVHGDAVDRYCSNPAPARKALGLTGIEAAKEIEVILEIPKADRPVAERRKLAGLFLAAGDPWSAIVQWLRLDAAERQAEDGLTQELVDYLNERTERRGENTVIAIPLAVRLGHERLYLVDDHSYAGNDGIDREVYNREIQEIWNNDWVKQSGNFWSEWSERVKNGSSDTVLEWYRAINDPETGRRAIAGDFGAAVGADVSGNSGRKYFAYWETRNLRMVANIREVIGDGGRVLAIVGAGHKPYYERYLGVTSDLEITDVLGLLGQQS